MPLVPVNSLEELQKILAIREAISKQAEEEIMACAGAPMKDFVANASRVLEKYARYPTLTEYRKVPHLADAEKWGATFGVTTILTMLVLNHARAFIGTMPENFHRLFVQFLEKLRDAKSKSIVMDDLTKAFAVLSEAYGMVYTRGDTLSLTVTGSRVLLHTLDANMFVEETSRQMASLVSENPS
jgi:hypothetical protein